MKRNILLLNFLFSLISTTLFFSSCEDSQSIDMATSTSTPTSFLEIYRVDPLEKILLEQKSFTDNPDIIRVARGEVATVQLLVKSFNKVANPKVEVSIFSENNSSLKLDSEVSWVGYVGATDKFRWPSSNLITSSSNRYPDVLFPIGTQGHDYLENQPFWISVPIPETTAPGTYKGRFTLSGKVDGKDAECVKEFTIQVYPPIIKEQSLLVSNWHYFTGKILGYMNNGIQVQEYSALYWDLLKQFADKSSEFKINVHYINTIEEISYTLQGTRENGTYSFDFSNFNKQVQLFENAGALKRLTGGHLANRSGDYYSDFYIKVPKIVSNSIRIELRPADDPIAVNYLSQFIPALKNNLVKKGWYNIYMQHIADEPENENVQSYQNIYSLVKSYAPDMKTIDANYATNGLDGYIDVWVPQLEGVKEKSAFFESLTSQGKEVWYYTCMFPQRNFANRFIQQPLIETRMLHWINFKYNLVGYLHWATNFWTSVENPYVETTNTSRGFPGGDSFIMYPGYRTLYSSIRLHAMRDGITDYELLKMLSEVNPQKAKQLSDALIQSLDRYNHSLDNFRQVRKELLEALSN